MTSLISSITRIRIADGRQWQINGDGHIYDNDSMTVIRVVDKRYNRWQKKGSRKENTH